MPRSARASRWPLAALAVALSLFMLGEARAQRASNIQLTPDSRTYLINKNVGAERWVISFDLASQTVTGNVFKDDGTEPSFLWCEIRNVAPSEEPSEIVYTLDCFGADGCAQSPCRPDAWRPIAENLEVSGSFLLPEGTRSTLRGNVQPIFDRSCAGRQACHAAGGVGRLTLDRGLSWAATVGVPAEQAADGTVFYVEPFQSDASYLVAKIRGDALGARMPLGEPPLPASEIDTIVRWILEGAGDN